jgi:hypothetical protein
LRQDFSATYEDSIGSIFQPWEMGHFIRGPREQNAITIFRLSHKKNHSAYSPYAPSKLNLALTQEILAQNEKSVRSFLSILDRMQ